VALIFSVSIAQSRNLATQQSRNLERNGTITQPCNPTIMQPCNATITQHCNTTITQSCNKQSRNLASQQSRHHAATITQPCNATITQHCNTTITQSCNKQSRNLALQQSRHHAATITQPCNATITQPCGFFLFVPWSQSAPSSAKKVIYINRSLYICSMTLNLRDITVDPSEEQNPMISDENLEILESSDARFRCKYCSADFDNDELLIKHCNEIHAPKEETQLQCHICLQHFKNRASFKKHVGEHSKGNFKILADFFWIFFFLEKIK
jgi:hypothetical protein